MVEQFGFAMIPLWLFTASGLTSGTTNGTSGSILKALELSTTTAPAFAATGANSLLMPAPALNKAISMSLNEFFVSSSTSHNLPQNSNFLPLERPEARSRMFLIGNFLCSRTFINSPPTMPVAPTIATLYFFAIFPFFQITLNNLILFTFIDLARQGLRLQSLNNPSYQLRGSSVFRQSLS